MEENSVGGRIRALRRAKNITQDELAVLVNSSRVQINQWETGARELPMGRLDDFAAALDTSCDYLLRGVPYEKNWTIVPSSSFKTSSPLFFLSVLCSMSLFV